MNVGVGVITAGVREIIPKLQANTKYPIEVYLDEHRKGPAHARNQLLKSMMTRGMEYMFIFDDDCYPTMGGWEDYFIDFAVRQNVHFMGIPHVFADEPVCEASASYWPGVLGCFTFQTRKFMEEVGYYNTSYDVYGFEDSGRNNRAWRAGLTGDRVGYFSLPHKAGYYIHSEDLYHESPEPNISAEDKARYISKNHPIYIAEITSPQLYYPYVE